MVIVEGTDAIADTVKFNGTQEDEEDELALVPAEPSSVG